MKADAEENIILIDEQHAIVNTSEEKWAKISGLQQADSIAVTRLPKLQMAKHFGLRSGKQYSMSSINKIWSEVDVSFAYDITESGSGLLTHDENRFIFCYVDESVKSGVESVTCRCIPTACIEPTS